MRPETPDLIEMLRKMILIREFDELALKLRAAGKIYGTVHPYVGQEAVAVGVCANLTNADRVTSTHRGHGHCIAKGADIKRMMAELFGRVDGYCKGKGGSMHIADFAKGMLGANGIVAGGISIVTGAGLAAQLLGNGRVAVSFFGDGAANAGPFHESINIAAAWKLPVIYVCENNLYAAQTGQMATHAMPDVAGRAGGYGIPGVVVDGNDIFAVHEAASKAVARARAGEGPTLIECKTYRHRPHTERKGQPDHRPREEVALWMSDARDPIARLVAHLKRQQGQLTDDEWKEMDREILTRIERAVAFAKASPFPRPEAATEDVFAAS